MHFGESISGKSGYEGSFNLLWVFHDCLPDSLSSSLLKQNATLYSNKVVKPEHSAGEI